MKKSIWVLLALLISAHAFAEEIEVPEEELARESTLPVFNKRRAVLNRSVLTSERIELGIGPGFEMNEPYYNQLMGIVQGTYNFTETSALNVQGLFWFQGLSSYGNQLQSGSNGKFEQFDANKAPHPQWGLLANYEYIAYYGKISITKQTVMNLNLFGLIGLGYLNMNDVSTVPLNVGLGQNFFFTSNVGLRFDLRYLIFQGPNATSQHLRPQDKPSSGSFDNRIYFNSQIGASLVVIL